MKLKMYVPSNRENHSLIANRYFSLVFGDITGNLASALSKANTLTAGKSGPFDLALFLASPGRLDQQGDGTTLEEIGKGEVKAELPVYIVVPGGGTKAEGEGEEEEEEEGSRVVGPRVTVLSGSSARLKTLDGLEIALATADAAATAAGPSVKRCDILVSETWPRDILAGVPEPKKPKGSVPSSDGEGALARAAQGIKPRYHFTSPPAPTAFYERPPFYADDTTEKDEDGTPTRVTRFISLGKFADKATRWFYAFTIDVPATSAAPASAPADTLPNPYTYTPAPPPSPPQSLPTDRFAKRTDHDDTEYDHRRATKRGRRDGGPPPSEVRPDTCFLCLSNPALAAHLLASIGPAAYLTLPKGPLPLPATELSDTGSDAAPALPRHVLIVPIAHLPVLPPGSLDREAASLDRHKFLLALAQMYSAHGLALVATELSRPQAVHLHTQVVAVPLDRAGDVLPAFKAAPATASKPSRGRGSGHHHHRGGAPEAALVWADRDIDPTETSYLRVQLLTASGARTQSIVAELPDGTRVDAQFGRRVLASVLGLDPQCADWRRCVQTDAEEKRDCEVLKKEFKDYDFTL